MKVIELIGVFPKRTNIRIDAMATGEWIYEGSVFNVPSSLYENKVLSAHTTGVDDLDLIINIM